MTNQFPGVPGQPQPYPGVPGQQPQPYPGQYQQPQYPPGPPPGWQLPPAQPPKKRHVLRTVLLSIFGVIVLIIIISVAASGGSSNNGTGSTGANASAVNQPSAAGTGSGSGSGSGSGQSASQPSAPKYTAAQRQAIESAESYLSDGQGFSRAGLITQLDSNFGEGFPKKLAVFAVDHIKVNWDKQAVISAKGYMHDGQGFSHDGLIEQLHSSFGEGFTLAQAEYAVKKVGL